MKNTNTWLVSSILLLLAPVLASAEIHQCNGLWTNKPCEGTVGESISETQTKNRSAADAEKSQKGLWIHELDMKRLRAKKQYNISIDTQDTTLLCNTEKTSLLDCRKGITEKENLIEEKILTAKDLEIKRRESKAQAKKTPDPENNQTVVIQNWDERHRRRRDFRELEGTRTPPAVIKEVPDDIKYPSRLPPSSPTPAKAIKVEPKLYTH